MKRWLAALACTFLLGGLFNSLPAVQAQDEPPVTEAPGFDQDAANAELTALFETSLQNRVDALAPLIFDMYVDHIVYSNDGQIAALWVGMRDPQSGESVASEPSLVLANRASLDSAWKLVLPMDAEFAAALTALPDEVLSQELRETFLAAAPQAETLAPNGVQTAQVFSGYRLPWAGGQSKHLSGSIGHYLVYNPPSCSEYYCRYAFDFAGRNTDPNSTLDTRFPLLAAKGGEVYAFYDGCATGNSSCTNYIVLKDSSTSPVTYQTYLHLDYNTIPVALKVQGTQVLQGQWIGNVDDTGYSTGDHVHFHVYATPTGTYWGPSVDITFDDVDINGGRPRTCLEANNWPSLGSECHPGGDEFVSANYGAYPPTAALTLPAAGEVITNGNLFMAGQAWDNVGVMKAQAIFKINGTWQLAGLAQTLAGSTYESYMMDVDICTTDASLGPLEVGVRVWDYEGNASIDPQSVRTVTNRTFCKPPPPVCQPGANQVALYSGANYTGSCKLLSAGNYTSASAFSPVADDALSSLLVGSSVQAVLYEKANLASRSETITQNDVNLADNRIGDNTMSSISVTTRSLAIAAPLLNTPFNVTTAAVTNADSLVLDWAAPGAVSFQSALAGPLALSLDWTDSNGWSVGSLPAGDYSWTVTAKTITGATASNNRTFTVAAAGLPAAPAVNVPATQMEDASGWTATSAGLWRSVSNYLLGGRNLTGWFYSDPTDGNIGSPTVGASDLTSPPFTVPAGQSWLAFDYNTLTESAAPYWDQRWVQISMNGGRFVNLQQMWNERMDAWLSSQWIDLSPYAGQSVRLRFHFDIVDGNLNGSLPGGGVARGWAIDNVRVFNAVRPACFEAANETAAQATPIGPISNLQGGICPTGDVDFYRLHLLADQGIFATLTPSGAPLELALIAADGRSVMRTSSQSLSVYAAAAGDYYLRVRAFDHPGVGGDQVGYNLQLESFAPVSQMQPLDSVTNSTAVLLKWDASETIFGLGGFKLEVDAGNDGTWVLLDGTVPANVRSYWFVGQAGVKYAFRMQAYDQAGNIEALPGAAEAVTTLAASCTGDSFENGDDTSGGAVNVTPGAPAQERSLCGTNDPDWVKFMAAAGQDLWLLARPVAGGAAVKLSLYAPGNTTTPIATVQSGGLGQGALLRWKVAAAGEYRLKIEPLRADLWGTQALYVTWLGAPKLIYLPVMGKN